MRETTTEAIVEDIRRVARKERVRSLSRSEYHSCGGLYSDYHLYDGGRTWEDLCIAAGVHTKKKNPVSDEVYFQRLRNALAALGRYPKTSERKQFGLNFRKRRWPTLKSFIEAAIKGGFICPPAAASASEPVSIPCRDEQLPAVQKDRQPAATLSSKQRTTRPIPPIPTRTKRRRWKRSGVEGFPYAPQDEQGVVALFAILCHQRRIPWQILDLNAGKGIDAICYEDEHHRELRVELKYTLSQHSWNHSIEDVDYVVCWDNRWEDFPKPVIELRSLTEHLSQ